MPKIQMVRQTTQSECGLCCVSMVASYFGFRQPISYYRNKYDVGRDGLSFTEMYNMLCALGLHADAYEITDTAEHRFDSRPFIVMLGQSHYVTVKKGLGSRMVVFDPAKGKYHTSQRELAENMRRGLFLTAAKGEGFQTCSGNTSDYRHFGVIVRSLARPLILAALVSIIVYLINLLVPVTMQNVINGIVYGDESSVSNMFGSVVVILAVLYFVSLVRNRVMLRLQVMLYDRISLKTVSHLFRVPFSFFDNRSQGNILFRVGVMSQLQSVVSSVFTQGIVSLAGVIVIFAYLVLIYPALFLLLLCIIAGLILFTVVTSQIIIVSRREEMNAREKVDSNLTEIINNMYEIHTTGMKGLFWSGYVGLFNDFVHAFTKTQKKVQHYNLLINILFTSLPIIVILILMGNVGIYNITIGQFFAIFSLLNTLFSQCMGITAEVTSLSYLKTTLHYYNDMIDEKELENDGANRLTRFSSLELDSVDFKYSDSSAATLHGVNMSIKQGEKIALVGKSGSGKTTLIKLLAGLYPPTEGRISINNKDMTGYDEASVKQVVSFVSQSPVIFNKTIRENLTLGNENISNSEIEHALAVSYLSDDVSNMPLGLDTILSGHGSNLSGGQIQRLSIARAILNHPQVIIMDEATNSLDSFTENEIYKNLHKESITQVIISHRLSTTIDANRIYCLKDGTIYESGTHRELMMFKGHYANLYYSQNVEEDIS